MSFRRAIPVGTTGCFILSATSGPVGADFCIATRGRPVPVRRVPGIPATGSPSVARPGTPVRGRRARTDAVPDQQDVERRCGSDRNIGGDPQATACAPCSPIRVVLYSRVAREATRKWMSRREGTMMTPLRRYSALFTLCLAVVLVGGMSTMHAAAQEKPGVDACSTCSGPDRRETESGTEGGTSGGDGSGSKRGSGGTGGELVIPRIPIPTLSWPPPRPPTWTPPQWTPPSWSRPSVPSWTPEVTPSPPQRLESLQPRSEQPGATTVEDTVAPAGPTTPRVEAGRSRAPDDSAPPAPPPESEVGSAPLAPPAPSESPAPPPLPAPSTADVESKAVVTDFQAWLLFAAALAGTFLMVRVARAHRRYTSRRDLVTRFETRLAATPVVVDMPEDPLPTRSIHLELRISNQEES